MISDAKGTELIKRASIDELIGHRNRALELYKTAFDMIVSGNEAFSRAVPSKIGYAHIGREEVDRLNFISEPYVERTRDDFVERCRKHIDRMLWEHLLLATGIGDVMDAAQKEQFRKQVSDNPPVCSAETCAATCLTLAGRAPELFDRSVITVFESLCRRRYKSHDGWEIGPRIIMTYTVSFWSGSFSWSYSSYANGRDRVRDMDRIFHILDGKTPPGQEADCTNLVAQAMTDRNQKQFSTPYFRFRWFENGNLHVYILRDDLREKANRIVARHHENTLADTRI